MVNLYRLMNEFSKELDMIERLSILAILVVLIGISSSHASSSETKEKIDSINAQLESIDDPKTKAKLYCYRARNHTKSGDHEKAKADYLKALNTSYEGWILKELGYFMYKLGEYEKAYNVSVKLLDDFPYLEQEATKLKTQAKNKWEEEYLKKNPPTITIDTVPDPNRVTRHDMIQQTETSQRSKNSGGKQTNKSNRSGYKYWDTHPKTKNIPVPKQRNLDY